MADGDYSKSVPESTNNLIAEEEVNLTRTTPTITLTTEDEEAADDSKFENDVKDMEISAEDLEEARKVGQEAVDEVISLAEKADSLKEHDVIDEEAAEAQRVKDALAQELKENDGWVKILGNEELMKKAIKEGELHCRPLRGDLCTIRIIGKLTDDESIIFENEDSFQMQLGDAEVIPGLDLTIPLMTRGEIAIIKVAHRFGYGSKGLPPLVPPSADLTYEVELLSYETEKDLGDLTVTERRAIGNRKRERGNFWYGRGESSLAVQSYRRALEFLDEVEGGIQFPSYDGSKSEKLTPEIREMFEDRLKTLNNMAAAQLKLQAYEPALTSVEAVLKCQPNNVKALFRKGKILGEKGDTVKALKILNKAKLLEPENTAVSVEINKLNKRRKVEHQGEKALYKRMFQDSSKESEDREDSSPSKGASSLKSTLSIGIVLSGVAVAIAGIMAYRYRLV